MSGSGFVQLVGYWPVAWPGKHQNLACITSANGLAWQFASVVEAKVDDPLVTERPGENDLIRLDSAELFAVYRVSQEVHYRSARSTDDGKSWGNPVSLPFGSVRPKSVRLSDGRIAISGGRPGLWIRVSTDATATSWTSVNVAKAHNALVGDKAALFEPAFVNATTTTPWSVMGSRESTCYTSFLTIPDGTVLLLYDRLSSDEGWSNPVAPLHGRAFAMRFVLKAVKVDAQEADFGRI